MVECVLRIALVTCLKIQLSSHCSLNVTNLLLGGMKLSQITNFQFSWLYFYEFLFNATFHLSFIDYNFLCLWTKFIREQNKGAAVLHKEHSYLNNLCSQSVEIVIVSPQENLSAYSSVRSCRGSVDVTVWIAHVCSNFLNHCLEKLCLF
jgi:hypothetical protein